MRASNLEAKQFGKSRCKEIYIGFGPSNLDITNNGLTCGRLAPHVYYIMILIEKCSSKLQYNLDGGFFISAAKNRLIWNLCF
jgi:hypothetical protein